VIALLMTPARFLAGIGITLLTLAALVFGGAWLQNWLDRGLDPPPDERGGRR